MKRAGNFGPPPKLIVVVAAALMMVIGAYIQVGTIPYGDLRNCQVHEFQVNRKRKLQINCMLTGTAGFLWGWTENKEHELVVRFYSISLILWPGRSQWIDYIVDLPPTVKKVTYGTENCELWPKLWRSSGESLQQ